MFSQELDLSPFKLALVFWGFTCSFTPHVCSDLFKLQFPSQQMLVKSFNIFI